MKNVSSLKSNNTNSPKTPGGISKSLLTPCRRVGLSRNWRKSGPSPFVSPVTGSTEVKEEKAENRKRKERVLDENVDTNSVTPTNVKHETNEEHASDNERTPSRSVELPRRKKSKTLLNVINKSQEDDITNLVTEENKIENFETNFKKVDCHDSENVCTDVVSTPVRTKSKKKNKRSPALKSSTKEVKVKQQIEVHNNENIDMYPDKKPEETSEPVYAIKEKSPNDLRKECIVVIQRKIFKKIDKKETEEKDTEVNKDKNEKVSSQALFDSDSDEVPLNQLSTKDSIKPNLEKEPEHKTDSNKKELDEDDDFTDKSTKTTLPKTKESKSPKNIVKSHKSSKTKSEKGKIQPKPSSQSSYDDDDDDFDNKKTILIRKTYEKVSKPLKAKSTGSITQRDIDELRARIEAKKKLLLAKSINPDTEELRTLIKKWQKGCQDALIELLDLMKTKFHDKQDMDYSEMLKTLKIPPALVGYDSENDCFNSPTDASIILGQFNE